MMLQFAKTLVMIEILLVAGLLFYRVALSGQGAAIVSRKAIGLTMLTPAVGLFCGNVYIFDAYLMCVVAFNSRSRSELASIYALMLPMIPLLSVETAVGSVYITALTTVMAMNLGALIGFAVTSGRKTSFAGRYDWAIAALILIFLYIGIREASFTAIVRSVLVYTISYAGPFLLVSRGVTKREDLDRLLLRLMLGAVMTSLVGVYQAIRHWLLYQTLYDALHVQVALQSWTLALRGGLLRTGGAMLDYGAAGVFLSAMFCIMPFLWTKFKPGFNWLVLLILAGGLIAAQLRGGWIAAIVGITFVLLYRRRWGVAAAIGGFAVLAEAFVLLYAQSGKLASIAGATAEASGTVTYRRQLLSRGLEQVQSHPIFGQTQQQLIANLPDLIQGQKIVDFVNTHLFIAMAAGLPLFALWMVVWTVPVVQSWRLRHLTSANAGLAGIPAAILAPTMIALSTTSIIDRNLVWPTIALALAGPCFALARTDGARLAEPRPRRLVWGMAGPPDAVAGSAPGFDR